MDTNKLFILLIISLFINGCASNVKKLNADDPDTLRIIRTCIIEHVKLSDIDKKTILERPPSDVAVYKTAGTHGQFGWSWELSDNRKIFIDFTGDLININCGQLRFKITSVEISKH
jgi:hypothetical protein